MSVAVAVDNTETNPNPSGIIPTEYKVLIKPKTVEEVTKGGIIIPETAREKEQYAAMEGTIVAQSPIAFQFDNWPPNARIPQPGDTVIYAKYAGAVIKGRDGQDYRLINDKDVGAILTD